ncbi:transcription factor 7-like 2 [Sinocyclocheilus grahami]|uniref:transcription factor 7-like 2 n=1 Tax=Sinocyclocheilus grahami TaxID=75366 RepID=UPI0007AD5119|nr:PREDICTED: transcription factor 7-like 2 [Sinocyclocheilus grahami]
MPQLNGGGGDDLGANDEMIPFKDEEDHEKIRESAFTESDLADLKSSLVNESEISQNSNSAVIRRGQQEDQRIYTDKREHLDVPRHQDGGMYKAPYSGYPFLMLPEPYLPNGPVSPSVSS